MCWKKSIIGKTIAFSKKVGNIKFSVQCSLDNFRSYDVSYNTIINHNTPLSPRFSASLYTHTAIKIATINQTAAIARPKIAHAAP
jgi:hypothetical protein